jgi:hypothetical protein
MSLQEHVYYSDTMTTLYCGDARALLPLMADASADFIFTDPPYGRAALEAAKREINAALAPRPEAQRDKSGVSAKIAGAPALEPENAGMTAGKDSASAWNDREIPGATQPPDQSRPEAQP